MTRILWFFASLAIFAAVILLWHWASVLRLVPPIYLPGPLQVGNALWNGLVSGDALVRWLGTLQRMVLGWLLASIIGVGIGALVGASPIARAYLMPMLEFMRPLPASAIIPLAIAVMGMTDSMVLAVIAFGAVWPVLLGTVHGFAAVEPRLYEVGRILRLTRLKMIWSISLPNAMPDILAGLRIGLTIALILSVVGEMLTSRNGLGSWILLSSRSYRAADMYAGVALLSVTGILSTMLVAWLEKRALAWRNNN